MSVRVFVGNLPFSTTERELCCLFGDYKPRSAIIPTDQHGRSRGFGFVEIPAQEASDAIGELEGSRLAGRALKVDEALPRDHRWRMVWDNRDGWCQTAGWW